MEARCELRGKHNVQPSQREAAIITLEQLEKYRDSARKFVELDVAVYSHGYVILKVHATNLGPDGIFIDARPANMPISNSNSRTKRGPSCTACPCMASVTWPLFMPVGCF
jgi:hypothetical protein